MFKRIRPRTRTPLGASGFTMIELVVVIVILAVLGGMALPRFHSLGQEARISAVRGMAAALSAASGQLRAKCALTRGCPMRSGAYALPYNGQTFAMWNGFVDAGDNYANVEIEAAVQYSGFTLVKSPTRHTFTKNGAPTPANCSATYREARWAGDEALVSVVTTGC